VVDCIEIWVKTLPHDMRRELVEAALDCGIRERREKVKMEIQSDSVITIEQATEGRRQRDVLYNGGREYTANETDAGTQKKR